VKKSFLHLMLMLGALPLFASEVGFDRYELIIEKKPFGDDPPEAEAVQISLNESFAKNMRLSMLFEGPNGDIRAGIIDDRSKKNYILRIGEIEDSIELVEANLQASEALVRKGNEIALFKLKEAKPELLSKTEQKARQSSYTERRQALLKKKEQAKPKQPAEPRLTGEALRKHLEEVQMDAIRTGKPPLPMPLTPEMDAQLVSEGVLDPL
jgi:hypothetical protein